MRGSSFGLTGRFDADARSAALRANFAFAEGRRLENCPFLSLSENIDRILIHARAAQAASPAPDRFAAGGRR
ncbi:MAG: hypothetical protein ACPL7A_00525, partial [Anaerolineales bacterium]